jgi:hypothetical protein
MQKQAQELSLQIQAMQQVPASASSSVAASDMPVQPPPLPPRQHSSGSVGAPSPASSPTRLASATLGQMMAPSPLPHPHQLAASSLALRSRLIGMGFAELDITDGMRLLSDHDRLSEERAFMKVLDFATVVGEVTDAGYERDVVVAMIEQVVGLDHLTPQNVVRQLEANGMKRKP